MDALRADGAEGSEEPVEVDVGRVWWQAGDVELALVVLMPSGGLQRPDRLEGADDALDARAGDFHDTADAAAAAAGGGVGFFICNFLVLREAHIHLGAKARQNLPVQSFLRDPRVVLAVEADEGNGLALSGPRREDLALRHLPVLGENLSQPGLVHLRGQARDIEVVGLDRLNAIWLGSIAPSALVVARLSVAASSAATSSS
eukprot:CAMPEP_0183507124 /NCGR_PEP_ID=MMETSP0371-20130417/7985_1 /TAXON_ID=268820 /ORGANISM="Peridinium aciculiferum, Strain PAER-2" /LENGTH=201 /DNA_ID=CAMNT_0025703257 /DNA_START=212 /DNA_END=814 /DNA_ORIENTATION=+